MSERIELIGDLSLVLQADGSWHPDHTNLGNVRLGELITRRLKEHLRWQRTDEQQRLAVGRYRVILEPVEIPTREQVLRGQE